MIGILDRTVKLFERFRAISACHPMLQNAIIRMILVMTLGSFELLLGVAFTIVLDKDLEMQDGINDMKLTSIRSSIRINAARPRAIVSSV